MRIPIREILFHLAPVALAVVIHLASFYSPFLDLSGRMGLSLDSGVIMIGDFSSVSRINFVRQVKLTYSANLFDPNTSGPDLWKALRRSCREALLSHAENRPTTVSLVVGVPTFWVAFSVMAGSLIILSCRFMYKC